MPATKSSPSTLDLAELYELVEALRRGNFDRRIDAEGAGGRAGMIARTLNATMEMLATFKAEQLRVANELGTAGQLGGTMEVFGATGGWLEMADAVNRMSAGLTVELRRTGQALAALSHGQPIAPLEPQMIGGEVAALEQSVNALSRL